MSSTCYCLNCHAVIARGSSCCPSCGSTWKAEAIPATDDGPTCADLQAALDEMNWTVRTAGELASEAHVIGAKIVGHVAQLRRIARVRDRVRKEAVSSEAESLAAIAHDLDTWAQSMTEFQQALAARGGS